MVGVRRKCAVKDVGPVMSEAFAIADQQFQSNGLSTDGEKASVYHDFDMKAQTFDFTSGHLMSPPIDQVPAELESWSILQVQALRVDHVGTYENLGNAWNTANQYARYKKLKQSREGAFELYKNDPDTTAPADVLTEIFLPLK